MLNCPFCRTHHPGSDADTLAMIQARVEKKDSAAIFDLWLGLRKDDRRAVELWTEAAELASVEALYSLGIAYQGGTGVEVVDKKKGIQFWKNAAMRGHALARHHLGCHEGNQGNYDRAVRHLLISAKMGYDLSVERIKEMFMKQLASKEQYAQALKEYQDAMEEMKSHDRDVAKKTRKLEISFFYY